MKNIFFYVFLFSAVTLTNAQKKKVAAIDTVPLNFEITHALTLDGKEVTNFSYCLHHASEKLDSAFVKKGGVINITLKRNEIYTMSYHKEGQMDKYIMFDTHVPSKKGKKELYEVNYEIELDPANTKHKEEFKDHPVAIIKYLPGDDFDFSKKYHEQIHHVKKPAK